MAAAEPDPGAALRDFPGRAPGNRQRPLKWRRPAASEQSPRVVRAPEHSTRSRWRSPTEAPAPRGAPPGTYARSSRGCSGSATASCRAQARAHELGLGSACGDLAVSIDRGARRPGRPGPLRAQRRWAPARRLQSAGQNWVCPAYPQAPAHHRLSPFIATLRASMRHGSALRVDHVMGQMRCTDPRGHAQCAGRVRALSAARPAGDPRAESQRNQCMVIGEDLGTVPDQMRQAMYDYGVLSTACCTSSAAMMATSRRRASIPPGAVAAAPTTCRRRRFWAGRVQVRLGWACIRTRRHTSSRS